MESSSTSPGQEPAGQGPWREVAALFLRLGFTAVGGPAAHIAMIRDEVVERRRWMTDQDFVDLLAIVNLVPGPNSTEMAISVGYMRAGWRGLLAAGICFIAPAMLIVMTLAAVYVRYGALPQVQALFYGIQPAVIAIVAVAVWRLGRTVIKGLWPLVLAAMIIVPYLLGVNVLILLIAGGLLTLTEHWLEARRQGIIPVVLLSLPGVQGYAGRLAGLAALVATAAVPFSYTTLFLTFLKIGAVLYGSGYVLLAFLRSDFVLRLQWLTDQQLLDAISVGQFTPGPVFTTATFIGFILGGIPGGLVATAGIFLPSFVFIALIHPIAARLRANPWTSTVLDGVNVAAVALMAGVLLQLTQSALVDVFTVVLAAAALVVLLRFHINSAWIILAGALAGLAHYWLLR